MSGRRDDSRRRRDYSPRRRSPSSSPGPSRGRSPPPKPRDPKNLPESFGRVAEAPRTDDELSVLQRMGSSFRESPLHNLYKYLEDGIKVKVWTRNHKDVRGVLTGYIVAFDKHWNLIMKDCNDIFHKPKKCKTPFLRNLAPNEALPDMPPKVIKQKSADPPKPPPEPQKKAEGKEGKRKKKSKKNKSTIERKTMKKLFIRGDNVVMICPDPTPEVTQESEEKE